MNNHVPTASRRRLLFIGPLPEPVTGHSLACQVLLEELQKTYDVAVVDLSKASFGGGVTSLGRIGEVGAILTRVANAARSADVVYLTISESVAGNLKDLLIYLLCWALLPRMLIHLHGGSIRSHIFDRYPLLRKLNAIALRRIGAVIVLGRTHLHVFDRMVPSDRVHIVANFAQDFLFADAAAITRKFQRTDVLQLLFLGNLIDGKGHADVLAGYQLLPSVHRQRVRLHFAGAFDTADDEAQFRGKIADDPAVTYHGVVSGAEKRALLHTAHVLVLPTRLSEGQPISILEAYAAGCVVMTAYSGGIPDIFTDGVHGFQVLPESPASVRDAIERALAGGSALEDVAQRNFLTALTSYRTTQYVSKIATLVERVRTGRELPAESAS